MVLFSGAPATAQSAGGPVFSLQPGMLISDFVSADNGRASSTGFNLRFDTRFPTRSRWLTPVIGASVLPYGTSAPDGGDLNTPVLFVGNVFRVLGQGQTGGWVSVELPLLLYHTYGGGSNDEPRLYGRDLHVQLATYLHVGQHFLREFGRNWRRLDLYAFVEQNLTPNDEPTTRRPDRFNPVALFGVSLSFSAGSP